MSYDCRTCGAFMHNDAHRCHPIWLVWCPEDYGDEANARKVRASAPEYAAEAWAAWSDADTADYTIVSGTPTTVCVRAEAGGEVLAFTVYGETSAQYHATSTALPADTREVRDGE